MYCILDAATWFVPEGTAAISYSVSTAALLVSEGTAAALWLYYYLALYTAYCCITCAFGVATLHCMLCTAA